MKKVIFILLLACTLQPGMAQVNVGLWIPGNTTAAELEKKSCLSALNRFDDIRITLVDADDLARKSARLPGIDILWIQRTDTGQFTPAELDPKLLTNLKSWLENGGKILLNQESFRYINFLELEPELPETRVKPCTDEGYGRKLGFHAFRDHPVFEGLFGGAYVQRPARDTAVRITGYFGDKLPSGGRVVAVDWDYIFLREDSKLVIEYDYGKGMVLAVGGYLSFSSSNLNNGHLAHFTANAARYLAGRNDGSGGSYWYFGPRELGPCTDRLPELDRSLAEVPRSKEWSLPYQTAGFEGRTATGNSWDVAGERIVIMGIERSGIEEVWTHPFMALRDLETGISTPEGMVWLSDLTPEIAVSPSFFTRTYRYNGGVIHEIIAASPKDPNGVVHYEYKGNGPATLVIRFSTQLRLMWPYSERTTGTLCYGWSGDQNAAYCMDRTGSMILMAGANRLASDQQFSPATDDMKVTATLSYQLGRVDQLDFVITGSAEGAWSAIDRFNSAVRDPESIFRQAVEHTEALYRSSLVITSPNDTFNQGYLWALAGTDKFYVTTPGMGSSLVAGYSTTRRGWDGEHKVNGRPGYAWYFGRDGQWSGLAMLDYGDFEKVRQILLFYEKYQDLSGKIYHEATTSGVIHYDASDATPLYILLAGRYFRHSNDTSYLRSSWPKIKKAIEFCFSTDTDGDKLIENTNVGHGWVEGGELYGSHSTLYLNACWASALEESYQMAGFLNDPDQQRYMAERNEIMNIINRDFWIASPSLGGPGRETGYYSYGKNRDGSFRKEITVLPAVPICFGLTEHMKARAMLDHYGGNTFTTNWGVRIIGDDSPLFRPSGYHYGSVWPLFTGWTALADYKAGNHNAGFSHIMNNLNVYRNWSLGYVEEVLNGAKYEPSGVCPHQCWSETMVLQPAIEGMLGLQVKADEGRFSLAPRLPADWDSLRVTNIRIGDQTVTFSFKRQGRNCIYTFEPSGDRALTVDFSPAFPAATVLGKAVLNGIEQPYTTFKMGESESVVTSFSISKRTTLIIQADKGIGMLPVIQDPSPGDTASGLRIVSARYQGNTYLVDVEGPAGTTGDFGLRLLNHQRIIKLVHCDIFQTGTDRYLLRVNFKGNGEKYVRKTLMIETIK